MNRFRIPSARLASWDYSINAAYFITICTANRQHFFGRIINTKIHLSKIGEFARECWLKIPYHFPHFDLDEFVIMPNHVHGIVMINKPYYVQSRLRLSRATNNEKQMNETNTEEFHSKPKHFRFRNQGKNTISAMVGSFKSAVTKECNENKIKFGWHPRFHDHIIRDQNEFFKIRNYILMNPIRWKDDEFF